MDGGVVRMLNMKDIVCKKNVNGIVQYVHRHTLKLKFKNNL